MRLFVDELDYGWKEGAALGRLSFTLGPGKLLAVQGVNGSGKTSLMLTLGGVLRPLAGSVRLRGAGGLSLRQHSFYLGPQLQFYPLLTALENASFLLRTRGLAVGLLTSMLHKYGVPESRKVCELSTGQVQRLRLACAAAAEQPLLLLDEPGLSLDAAGRVALRELIFRYKGLIVLASNDPGEVALADRAICLA
ncbi:MAG: ATP-binding cassette domain-containing protein [Bacillota bacterium]|nr:ATP-binding cassette domain-containing protein [Bacillota bacterium]